MNIPQQAFSTGLLDKAVHDRLLADLPKIASSAGIPARFVWTPLSSYCKGSDLEWVRDMWVNDIAGLCYTGTTLGTNIELRLMAIVGACLRNFVGARFMTVQSVLAAMKEDDPPDCRVLVIPNFCIARSDGGGVAPWEVASLLDLLYQRMADDKRTIIYVQSVPELEKQYGTPLRNHIESTFSVVA